MNKGYVVQATSEEELNFAEMLANSILSKNKNAKISLVTNQSITDNNCFDQIIEYPFYIKMPTRANDWQMYWASPYEYTMLLDCKMIVSVDQESLWDYLIDHYDVCIPTSFFDFRNQLTSYSKAHAYLEEYNMTTVFANMLFFNKSENALRYFKLLDPIIQNWEDSIMNFFAPKDRVLDFDIDLIHSIVCSAIDFDVYPLHNNLFAYVDMNAVHKNNMLPDCAKWTDILSTWHINNNIKIQNYLTTHPLYYSDASFYTEQLANDFRNYRNAISK